MLIGGSTPNQLGSDGSEPASPTTANSRARKPASVVVSVSGVVVLVAKTCPPCTVDVVAVPGMVVVAPSATVDVVTTPATVDVVASPGIVVGVLPAVVDVVTRPATVVVVTPPTTVDAVVVGKVVLVGATVLVVVVVDEVVVVSLNTSNTAEAQVPCRHA